MKNFKNIKKIMAAAVATTMLMLTGCGTDLGEELFSCNSDINDISDHKRDQQFKRSLEQLEQRPEDSFFPILFQKREYFFQIKPCFQSGICC